MGCWLTNNLFNCSKFFTKNTIATIELNIVDLSLRLIFSCLFTSFESKKNYFGEIAIILIYMNFHPSKLS